MKTRIQICKKTGNVKILDVIGAGSQCMASTAAFEKALGDVKENTRTLTDNYEAEPEPVVVESDDDG